MVNLVCTAITIVIQIVMAIILFLGNKTIIPVFANNCVASANGLAQENVTCDEQKSYEIGPMPVLAEIVFASSLLSVYFWICNYSFYKELKRGSYKGLSREGSTVSTNPA